jgi:hypothetical protein
MILHKLSRYFFPEIQEDRSTADIDIVLVEPQPPCYQIPKENCQPLDLFNSCFSDSYLIYYECHTGMDNVARMKVIKTPKYLSDGLLDD